jgi:hypothetical protein
MVKSTKRDKKYILVVGLGGGADAQVAYAKAMWLQANEKTARNNAVVVYATCKFKKEGGEERNPDDPNYITKNMYSVTLDQALTKEYINEKVKVANKMQPRWVGTSLMESTMPQVVVTYKNKDKKEVTIKSPVIIELDEKVDKWKDGVCMVDFDDDMVDETFRHLTPAGGWDVVVGVDSGGDVLHGGREDGRDRCMLELLGRWVHKQRAIGVTRSKAGMGKPKEVLFLTVVAGPCVDGECYFRGMQERIVALTGKGVVAIPQPMSLIAITLNKVTWMMEDSKTPKIMLKGVLGTLESATEPTDQGEIPECDAWGVEISAWVQLPQRHHKMTDGKAVPPVIVPSHWPSTQLLFDGMKLLKALGELEKEDKSKNEDKNEKKEVPKKGFWAWMMGVKG